MSEELRRWLLLIYRVPQDPPGRRTYVWRQLKQLGAHYLQQAAVILPDQEGIRTSLEALAQKIRDFGGEASLLGTASPDPTWQQETIERFNQARDAEYNEIMENVERFGDEIERERRKGRFAFAQLEDIEADCDKLQRWYARVTARDFFGASRRTEAEESLKAAQVALEAFTAEVGAHEMRS
jgi:hypothetical protein